MLAFFGRLQSIDRRWIYLVMFVSVGAALLTKITLPVIPSNQALGAYEAIEKAPTDKYALVGAEWSNSTRGENGAQTYALMHHLMRRHIKFAIVGFDPQGPTNVDKIVQELASEYGYVYGRDWVNWGFHPYNAIKATLKAMVRDMPGSMVHDTNNTPLTDTAKLPIMSGLKNMDQVGLIVEITPADTYESWVAFVQGYGGGKPMVYAPTAVMAPEAYQYLDSGQMVGMLTGLKGAIEYEGMVKKPGLATKQAVALSVAHVVILALIVLGNLGYLAQKRAQTRAVPGEQHP
jgi:hypothetical protein